VLEVTENLLVRNFDETRKRLEELKQVGVRLAVDDFGTGYSALSYLQRFPIDMLKIDRSFVAGLGQADGSTIVRAIIELGLGLDLDIVAEGIEEQEELDELRALHSNLGQGFYFARPLDPGALAELLRTPERQKAPAIA
jgi:EAL domain-containing protein (putative c-di-GMP-specific phosphodiesterase class I)